jgi:hypothetical protein
LAPSDQAPGVRHRSLVYGVRGHERILTAKLVSATLRALQSQGMTQIGVSHRSPT